jgi:hypothetical protein
MAGWGQAFGDQVIATAILDRLQHHSTIVNIKGESCRLKEKRKAGLLTRSDSITDRSSEVDGDHQALSRTLADIQWPPLRPTVKGLCPLVPLTVASLWLGGKYGGPKALPL